MCPYLKALEDPSMLFTLILTTVEKLRPMAFQVVGSLSENMWQFLDLWHFWVILFSGAVLLFDFIVTFLHTHAHTSEYLVLLQQPLNY